MTDNRKLKVYEKIEKNYPNILSAVETLGDTVAIRRSAG